MTEEFAVDLGSDLRWGEPTVPCLGLVTEIFILKIHWTEVQSCFVCACVCVSDNTVAFNNVLRVSKL